MVRLRTLSFSFRKMLHLSIAVGILATSGCNETAKPTVKAGDSATTYVVPPPPANPDDPKAGKAGGGSMSARELRNFKQKQGQP